MNKPRTLFEKVWDRHVMQAAHDAVAEQRASR